MSDSKYTNTDEIVCLYCLHEHRDSWECKSGMEGGFDVECDECERTFRCERIFSIHYNSTKIAEYPIISPDDICPKCDEWMDECVCGYADFNEECNRKYEEDES